MEALIGYTIVGVLILLTVVFAWFVFKARRTWAKVVCAVIAVILAVPSIFMIWLIGIIQCGWTFHVATLDCGQNRSIEIRAPYWCELNQSLHYQPRQGHKKLLRYDNYIGSTRKLPKQLKFAAVRSGDSNIVAVVEETNPEVVLVIHDFKRDWSWPENWDLPWEEDKRQAEEMLGVLNTEFSSRHFELSNYARGFCLIGEKRWKDDKP